MATSKGLKETICSPWASVPTPEPLVICDLEKSHTVWSNVITA